MPQEIDSTSAPTKRKRASNNKLHGARAAKNDEFYTQLNDIANELKHYRAHFEGKTVFCNCDDPEEDPKSNFWVFFSQQFGLLGLKRLVATHYVPEGQSYMLELFEDGGKPVRTPLQGNGDFRSPECVEILRSADIVVTNPPFSLFREYVAQLVEHEKKFLIVGNNNAITYKEIFSLIRANKLWMGVSPRSMVFMTPSGEMASVNANWFTNLEHSKRNEELILFKKYDPAEYPKYDNYDAIEVSKVAEIPKDYAGAMGVPITFLDKYNPGQFEILNCNDIRINASTPEKSHGLIKDADGTVNGKAKYVRIVIRRKV
jgi:hypothetical protein